MKKADINISEKENDFEAKGTHIFSLCKIKNEAGRKLEKILDDIGKERIPLLTEALYFEFRKMDARRRDNESDARYFEYRLGNIENILLEAWQKYNFYLKKLHHDFLVNQFVIENITTTVGRAVLAKRLAGINTYSGNVSHTALGTSATAPSVADTQLGTETYRKALSSGTSSNNISYLETFFTAAEVNGTFEEYGNFIDGSGSANSGQLFNRFTQTVAKSNVETLNVQSIITLNDA